VTIVKGVQSEEEMRADLARLSRLVEEGRVEEARRLAPELAKKWPESHPIRHLARVLEPPRVLPSPPGLRGRSFSRDYDWLREHAHEYPGCWIATYEDRLIVADPSLERVLEIVRATLGNEGEVAFLHHQPAEPA
jgi:hypothetical protein